MSGTLRSWIHYIDVRAEAGTQKEHRQVALAAQEEILKHFPSLQEYWHPECNTVTVAPYFDEYVEREEPKSWWWKFWS